MQNTVPAIRREQEARTRIRKNSSNPFGPEKRLLRLKMLSEQEVQEKKTRYEKHVHERHEIRMSMNANMNTWKTLAATKIQIWQPPAYKIINSELLFAAKSKQDIAPK